MAIQVVYYRGYLKSCNYRCSYCPFSKSASGRDLTKDEEALARFTEKIPSLGKNLSVMITPYGEALNHSFYHRAIARLCEMESVQKIGCQTNLSFFVPDFMSQCKNYLYKLRLWCSFHPDQTSLDTFLEQCEKLMQYGILFSVGVVAIPKNLETIRMLRSRLPDSVYLWVNAAEKRRIAYTEEEIRSFQEIDPLFSLELASRPSEPDCCTGGGESVFVEADGDVYSCAISRSRIGNIYSGEMLENRCKSKSCHCYLAYSGRHDVRGKMMSGFDSVFRIPQQAVFLDIDGTLTNGEGKIPKENIDAVEQLSHTHLVFLATSRPFRSARQVCRSIWPFLSGGVFAEGSDLRFFSTRFHRIFPLDEKIIEQIPKEIKHYCYREKGSLHKITLVNSSGSRFSFPDANCVYEDRTAGIVAKDVTKLSGILFLIRRLSLWENFISAVGNSDNDVPMLRHFTQSFAVPGASAAAKEAAGYIGGISCVGKKKL